MSVPISIAGWRGFARPGAVLPGWDPRNEPATLLTATLGVLGVASRALAARVAEWQMDPHVPRVP